MSSRQTMYIIDAHGLIYQMFHAIRDAMTSPDGRPTNAVFGVTRDLIYLHEDVRPDYLLCCFDLPGPTFRDEIYPEYKKNRPPQPEDLTPQIPMIQDVLRAMNLPVLSLPTFEADDVMATVACAAAERDIEVTICTSDKDCRQLIADNIRLYNLRKREVMSREQLIEDWGVAPEQVVDYQSMVGDSVDNVPGVTGVGAKTAAKLLLEYGTLDNIIAHVDQIKQPKMRENFKKAIADGTLERARKLVELRCDIPLEIHWEEWKRREWNGPQLLQLFTEFGFRRFSEQVRSMLKIDGKKKNDALLRDIGEEKNLFSDFTDPEFAPLPETPPQAGWKMAYTLVDDEGSFEAFFKDLSEQKRFAFDLETTGLDPLICEIVGLAFSWQVDEGYYLPLRGPESDKKLDERTVLEKLQPIFANPAIQKLNQNIKFDRAVLKAHHFEVSGVAGDSMIAHYLLHSGERSHGLDELTRIYLGHENISITELIGKGKNQLRMDQVPTAKVAQYAAEDADAAWRLTERLEKDLDREKLKSLYSDVEIPLIEVLGDMEHEGIRVDVELLKKMSIEMANDLARIEKQIHAAAGREFNIASPKQLREILFEELKLPVQKRTDLTGEASTDQETLEKLAALGHEIPKMITEHRQISKLKGTYVDALPDLVNPKTGRVHTSFNQTVAATGRLSSSNPNLQNIPARTDLGKQIRQAFIPREGWQLLTADYSQIELRLLAHFCGDEALQEAFRQKKDIHTMVAAQIAHVDVKDVSGDQRRMAKTVNFGVIYGMSAHGLAQRLNISRTEAEAFIQAYFARYPQVLSYQDILLKKCRKNGYVSTILGRKRFFEKSTIREKTSYQGRNTAEREAINMEIQGSAADLIKLAMLRIHKKLLSGWQSKMLLTVHDELVFEAPPSEVQKLATMVREEMSGAMELAVPLDVEIAVGPNWLDGEEIT
ncbi:DNA polymerase I [Telmatocola sphagniphila]|uniref:DNA polymerase I n=1 Tax=Telmatocola sphagniphila TaxID=1123043 RepID=A0A8E6EUW5_9BACT|nr:DNA polymerase I [Telmatocola sphagniphila]QVL31822.1 DNA polymerase I [Telmatocola sphagniphila]